MNLLLENLKHLYQRRSFFWLISLICGVFVFFICGTIRSSLSKGEQHVFLAPIALMLYLSYFIVALPIDILTKPFTYCLPGHRNIPGKFLLVVGLSLSFCCSLTFIFLPNLNFAQTFMACLAAFSMFSILFCLGAWLMSKNRAAGVLMIFIPLFMLPTGIMVYYYNLIITNLIVGNPLLMIAAGILANYLAWIYWGNPNLHRRFCGRVWMAGFAAWDRKKMMQFQLAQRDGKKFNSINVSPPVERFFISKISHAESGSLQQYIYGILYKLFAVPLSNWHKHLLIFSLAVCFCGYCGRGGSIFFFVMPIASSIHASLIVRSNLLISGGRRERFWSAVFLILALTLLITILLVIAGYITVLLAPFMPTLPGDGDFFTKYYPFHLDLFYLPLILTPLAAVIGFIFYKKPFILLFIFAGLGSTVFSLGMYVTGPAARWPIIILISLLCSWIFTFLFLRYFCMRKSLAA